MADMGKFAKEPIEEMYVPPVTTAEWTPVNFPSL
jgi:hypothetical protein